MHQFKTDSKRTWQDTKKITGKQNQISSPENIKFIKPLYKIHKTLAKEFNKFYTSVRPKPAKKIHNTEKTSHSNSKASIHEEIFPDSLKTAEVTRVFKSGDKDNVSNYCPIAILPVFSNVF